MIIYSNNEVTVKALRNKIPNLFMIRKGFTGAWRRE